MYEKGNVKIVTATVDLKRLLSFTACSDCCVGLLVSSYSAVP